MNENKKIVNEFMDKNDENVNWYDDPIFDNMEERYKHFIVKGDGWRYLQFIKENFQENEIMTLLQTYAILQSQNIRVVHDKS